MPSRSKYNHHRFSLNPLQIRASLRKQLQSNSIDQNNSYSKESGLQKQLHSEINSQK
ncbi:unnamed protein product [Moneuplotes crassus]|uniref:Uncharacterized protein n=1 Tax=Euplotes crassus TaxID=5936 RepID=A0AAD1XV00_EUPCR|nr:unnamed protein product [Moneuplotes crassus]